MRYDAESREAGTAAGAAATTQALYTCNVHMCDCECRYK